jgi:hypothetical protein
MATTTTLLELAYSDAQRDSEAGSWWIGGGASRGSVERSARGGGDMLEGRIIFVLERGVARLAGVDQTEYLLGRAVVVDEGGGTAVSGDNVL